MHAAADDSAQERMGEAADTIDFCGFTAAQSRPGLWHVVGGCGFQSFSEYEEHMEDYTVDSTGYENGIVRTVPIHSIEGVYLWQGDVEDSGRFWRQHKGDGTKESFVEIASHIPEVQEKLDAGSSLDQLLADPDLGPCAGIYFNPNHGNAPTLLEGDGFYVFQSNGRHRILAAKELGYSFPIRVIGKLVKKKP